MRRIKHIIIYLFLFALSRAQITTVTMQPGSTGIDAQLVSNLPTTNFGNVTALQINYTGSIIMRQLVAFDLTSIPSDAIVLSASLTLTGTGHTGTNPSYLRKNTSSWLENTVTWNTAPSTSTVGQVSLAQSTSTAQVYVLDVKDFVQEMVNIPAKNYGWTLLKQNETVVGKLQFASSDYSIASSRPKLEVNYCLPMDIKAYMTPATATASATGGLSTVIAGGVPPYTYAWSDGSTNKDISNKLPGVYSYTVTDNAGNKAKKDYIIAAENVSMTFTVTPDNLSGVDAIIQQKDLGGLENDNFKDINVLKSERGTASGWFISRSLFYFDFFNIPTNAIIDTAILNLYGAGHNTSIRPNTSAIYLNTSAWTEPTVTWSVQPSHTTTSYSVPIAATTSTNENRSLNLTSMVKYWVQNPSQNYGGKIMLTSESTFSLTSMVFGSSDNTNAALKPIIIIKIKIPKPPQFDILRRKLDGNYYQTSQGVLAFKFDEEYISNGVALEYKIYDKNRNVVISNASPNANVYSSYKDNRFVINLLNINPSLPSGYYVIEVKDKKGEIFMLRFKV